MNKEETKKFITECLKQPNDKYNKLEKALVGNMDEIENIKEKTKEDKAERSLVLLNKQLTRLQKGIDNPHVVFKKLGEHHYTVEFKI